MSRVSNRVDPGACSDLLAAPTRGTLAFVREGRHLELAPVRYAWDRGRHFVAAPEGDPPAPGARASLVLDEGWSWFALRAVTLRGRLVACPSPPRAGAWLELVPERVTAWDYGTLHVEPE